METEERRALSFLKDEGFKVIFVIELKRNKVINTEKANDMIIKELALPVNDESAIRYLEHNGYFKNE